MATIDVISSSTSVTAGAAEVAWPSLFAPSVVHATFAPPEYEAFKKFETSISLNVDTDLPLPSSKDFESGNTISLKLILRIIIIEE